MIGLSLIATPFHYVAIGDRDGRDRTSRRSRLRSKRGRISFPSYLRNRSTLYSLRHKGWRDGGQQVKETGMYYNFWYTVYRGLVG